MIKTFKSFLILGGMSLLVGCASTGHSPEAQKAYYEAQKAKAEEPLLEVKCPNGCKFGSLTLNKPGGGNNVQPLPVKTPGTKIVGMALDAATGVAPWLSVTEIATEGLEAAQGDVSNSHNKTETNNRRDTFGDNAGEKSGNEGRIESDNNDSSTENSGRIDSPSDSSSETSTDNSTDNSNNSGRISSDNP